MIEVSKLFQPIKNFFHVVDDFQGSDEDSDLSDEVDKDEMSTDDDDIDDMDDEDEEEEATIKVCCHSMF